MAEPQDAAFWQRAVRSGSVGADQLRACWEAIPPRQRASGAIDRRLARELVEAGHLTGWQARQLLRGASINVGRYCLINILGEGGMGRVFLARDTRLNRRVALKVLSPGRLADERAIARFRREARLGARLQHENLVRVYDEGEIAGRCYLVMEYIEGSSVGRLLAEYGPMPVPTASRLARQVALGLEHARQKGMIHRDVNPHNIMVTREGVAKLTDLGLAIELGDGAGLTLDGSVIGNYDYISPEQVHRSRGVDPRSDVYSLGCSLYHMVAGRVPFPCSSLPEKIHVQLNSDPRPLGSLVPGLPEGFGEVVSRMMRKSPGERFQGPMEVARALEPFIGGGATPGGFDEVTATHPGPAGDRATPPAPASSPGAAPPSRPGGMAGGASRVAGPLGLPAAPPRPAPPGGASRRRDSGPRWPRLARSPSPGPRGRVALLAGTLLACALVAVNLRGRAPARGPAPGPRAGSPTGATRAGAEGSLTVQVVGADGREETAGTLEEALRRAGRGGLRILLRGRGPVRLEAQGLEIPPGRVTIEADPGGGPVLVVSLAGGEPFLRIGTRADLKLDGLSIRAEYSDRGGKPPPLIESRGSLEIRRCAFWTDDRAVAGGIVSAEGPRLSAAGCWFGGFGSCLDVAAFAGTEVRLDQCMMIGDPSGDPWGSWAIRLRHEPSPSIVTPRRLLLRRCTIRDACLLRADDFHPAAPLEIAIEETVVQAGALLAWRSESGPDQGCLIWSGRGNVYDLSRPARAIRLDGPPNAAGGPDDPGAWAKLMDEPGSWDRPVGFPGPASSPRDSPRPADFSFRDRGGNSAGADPGQVGPEVGPPAGPDDRD